MRAIAVDWSGAKKPAGKIWIAEACRGSLTRLDPLDSREEAIHEVLAHLRSDEQRVAGLDFGFSLPAWFFRKNGLTRVYDLWALAEREGERWLRDCPWPFWGRTGKKRPALEAHFRRTEAQCQQVQGIRPKSIFQIGGAGAVGTGSIRGMPFLKRIHDAGFRIWPFDGSQLPLVLEIYPRILTGSVVKSAGEKRAAYLAAKWPDLAPEAASSAIRSEDAFDAAVSALIMAARFTEFYKLPRADAVARIEGEIWQPLR